MWKAFDLVNRKTIILKRKEENIIKSSYKTKSKLFDKIVKTKFNTLTKMQSFIAQADALAKGQAPIPQVPQVPQQNRRNPNQNNYQQPTN